MKKILVIDNYDSFVYNLVHYLKELGQEIEVVRNDKISLEKVEEYDKILLSPGPGIPSEAGIMPALIQKYAPTKSILGVCLGHQAIGEAFGAKLLNLPEVLHGISSTINIIKPKSKLFDGLPNQFKIGHYHSWVVEKKSIKTPLKITACDKDGFVMAISHETFDVHGVQFHPESVLTDYGHQILKNWLTEIKF
ncbi:MAG: aminodeoxychorismate/anthranilate synthase component II [Bacteroidetes bacterium]|nr:MAG: aminodeoxychorismate/anthranilate synthase component II [Bacteroidota bacterium]TAG95100.1 MAG: aminodeoxychorismate/anthranilate synthase component II [Bacteroidota bacterium]